MQLAEMDAIDAMTRQEEKWLRPQDIARKLDVSVDTVYRFIHTEEEKDKLEASKIGTQWRVKQSILDQWLEKHSNRAGGDYNEDSQASRSESF